MKGKTFLLVSPVVSFRLKKQTSRNVRASEIKKKHIFPSITTVTFRLEKQTSRQTFKGVSFSCKGRYSKAAKNWA